MAQSNINMEYRDLTPEEKRVIEHKGTEAPFSGEYNDFYKKGNYHCKRCDALLYKSDDKFNSHCGWPSFDDEIDGAVKRIPDADGFRIEIVCNNCGAHLGHVFEGEGFTSKDTRHCVNSVSLVFKAKTELHKAYYAGGCFWGVEYYFQKLDGVEEVISGYMGGNVVNPTYREVCSQKTGHLEVVEVSYNPEIISYEELTKYFFEIHDPTQANGQGPDIGEQYLSAIFYNNKEEERIANKLIDILLRKNYIIVTKTLAVKEFFEAEEYHQDYYDKHHKEPYCHSYTKRF